MSEKLVEKHPNECPFVDRSFIPTPLLFNEPVEYEDSKGIYVFYKHDDGFGYITNVQFCKLIGRKRDVFECLNRNEWKQCPYYESREEQ